MGWQRPRRRNPSFERRWSAATDSQRLTVAADLMRTFEIYGAKGADLEVMQVELTEIKG